MSYSDQRVPRDADGKIISHFYDQATDAFYPMTDAVRISGDFRAIGTNVVEGKKTATTTAAAAFAGASALVGRKLVYIYNPYGNTSVLYVGATTQVIDELYPGEGRYYLVNGATIYVKADVSQTYHVREW